MMLLLAVFFAGTVVVSSAAAAQYAIQEMTPEVQAALDGRRNRYEELVHLKKEGLVGENNRGYVEAFSERQDVLQLVADENRDRKIIYTTIARQNGLTGALATIERVFAQEQRDRAQSGVKIQNGDGSWVTK
ncbi:MAG TPA: DUF1318 domain-containing protein [Candidatus Omnitrophota bacterium]|nr:YdbL family protein [Candidatus Omnitrophota bacterium]HQO59173.1 DUF1318 domain-containing protein [Candidatus Omnitrophota bacterium]